LLSLLISLPLGMFVAFGISQSFLNLFNIDYYRFKFSNLAVAANHCRRCRPLIAGLIPVTAGAALTVRQAIASYGLGGDFGSAGSTTSSSASGSACCPRTMLRRWATCSAARTPDSGSGRTGHRRNYVSDGHEPVSSITNTLNKVISDMALMPFLLSNDQRIDRAIDLAQSIDSVEEAEVWYTHSASLLRQGQRSQEAGLGSSVEALPTGSDFFKPFMAAGRWLQPGDGRVVVMNRETAERNDIQLGDTVTLDMHELGKSDWQVVGLYQVVFARIQHGCHLRSPGLCV
jgi:putative ABC transport system permease protein